MNSEFVEAFYFYNHIHNNEASCFSKANDISAVIFSVKETKEALEDQVEIVDVGDVKMDPEEIKLFVRFSFNFINITIIGYIFQDFH